MKIAVSLMRMWVAGDNVIERLWNHLSRNEKKRFLLKVLAFDQEPPLDKRHELTYAEKVKQADILADPPFSDLDLEYRAFIMLGFNTVTTGFDQTLIRRHINSYYDNTPLPEDGVAEEEEFLPAEEEKDTLH